MVSGLVLAAGRSTRMGGLKQLLPFGDRTVVERVVSTLLTCPLHEVVVVIGHRAGEVRTVLAAYPVRIVVNPAPEGDMLSSVQCGVRAIPADRAILIALGDQPLLSSGVVDRLINAYHRAGDIAVPVYEGKRGHPMLVGPAFREELLALSGPGGVKQMRDRHPEAVREVPVDTDTILFDLDYTHDYQRALKRLGEGSDTHGA
jgi:molybdenum cofactor cytidylyltransferase